MYVVAEDNFATVYLWQKDEVLRVRSRLVGFVKDFPDYLLNREENIALIKITLNSLKAENLLWRMEENLLYREVL